MRKKKSFGVFLFVMFSALAADCRDEIVTPTGPLPEPEPEVCTAPSVNDATVSPRPPGTCPATGPCVASFRVSQSASIVRVEWSFSGCQPPESESFSGPDALVCPAPGTYAWSNRVCTTSRASDPTNSCCRPLSGSVTFLEG